MRKLVGEQISLFDKKMDVKDFILDKGYLTLINGTSCSIKVSQLAKDYGMKSAHDFNLLLLAIGFQYKVNGQWITKSLYSGYGLTESETFSYNSEGKRAKSLSEMKGQKIYTNFTPKGRYVLYKLLKVMGIVPEVERKDGYDSSCMYDIINVGRNLYNGKCGKVNESIKTKLYSEFEKIIKGI